MLAVLLVMALAAIFALIVVGAVHSLQVVERSDAAGWRAESLADQAVSAVTGALRWRPGAVSGTTEGGGADARQSWSASWTPARPVAGGMWPRLEVRVASAAGSARRDDRLTMELRAEPWVMGVTSRGDAEIDAPLVVSGSGVYVGGCLRGREHVSFAQDGGPLTPAGDPADCVRGYVYPAAAVHGGAGIFATGEEIHESSQADLYPLDTDDHAGPAVREQWLAAPPAEFLAAAAAAATPAGAALNGTRLRLDEITTPAGADAAGGTCIVLSPVDEVTIEGTASAESGRLLIVIRGDAVLGEPGETVAFSGGLVVRGHLLVRGGLLLEGSLHAGSLTITAPSRVSVAPDWRQRPVAGACRPTVVEYED